MTGNRAFVFCVLKRCRRAGKVLFLFYFRCLALLERFSFFVFLFFVFRVIFRFFLFFRFLSVFFKEDFVRRIRLRVYFDLFWVGMRWEIKKEKGKFRVEGVWCFFIFVVGLLLLKNCSDVGLLNLVVLLNVTL